MPKIEDGSNFGRSVLEEAVSEIQEAECQATSYLSLISAYFTNRAKVSGKSGCILYMKITKCI